MVVWLVKFGRHFLTKISYGPTTNQKAGSLILYVLDTLTFLFTGVFRRLSNVHRELDYFWCHGGHFVAKTVMVCPIHVCSKCILSIGFPFSSINDFLIWTSYLLFNKDIPVTKRYDQTMVILLSLDVIAHLTRQHLHQTS